MERRQVLGALVLAVCAAVLLAVPAVGVGTETPMQADNDSAAEDNGTFGEQMSAFMQTTAVDVNATTDSGMWKASLNRTDDPGRAVTDRANQLDKRLTRLETQLANLENGSGVAYTARASALRERLATLRTQVNETDRTAERVGVNVSKLDDLRTRASNMTGPEVAAAARNITDAPRGPPGDAPGGPPDSGPGTDPGPPADAGPSDNRTGAPDDTTPRGNVSRPGDRSPSGPPGHSNTTGPGPTNQTDTGPDPANRTGSSPSNTTETGPQNGSDSGPQNGTDNSPEGDGNGQQSSDPETGQDDSAKNPPGSPSDRGPAIVTVPGIR